MPHPILIHILERWTVLLKKSFICTLSHPTATSTSIHITTTTTFPSLSPTFPLCQLHNIVSTRSNIQNLSRTWIICPIMTLMTYAFLRPTLKYVLWMEMLFILVYNKYTFDSTEKLNFWVSNSSHDDNSLSLLEKKHFPWKQNTIRFHSIQSNPIQSSTSILFSLLFFLSALHGIVNMSRNEKKLDTFPPQLNRRKERKKEKEKKKKGWHFTAVEFFLRV